MLKKNHFKTIVILIIYFLITQSSFFVGVLNSTPIFLGFLLNIIFSVFFGVIFLYIFSHEDLFDIARQLEKDNIKKEKVWLHRFKNLGKSTVVFLIGILAGPLFAAITLRIILPKYKYRYTLMVFVATASAILWLGIARGIISFTIND